MMKNVIFTILIGLCGTLQVFAQVAITLPDTTVAVGDTSLLPVFAEINQADSVFGIRTEFSYNTGHLELIQLETAGSISDSAATAWSDNEGDVVVSLATVNPITDSGVLMYFRITPKNQDKSDFKLQTIRVNENDTESGTAVGEINSITTPVLFSLTGDTTEVRTTAALRIKLSGLLSRAIDSVSFTVDYQNPEFEYQRFRLGSNLNETDFTIEESILSDTEIKFTINAEVSITQDIELGEIELFGTSEGTYSIQIVEREIQPSNIETSAEFTPTVFTDDITPPEIPQNLDFTQSSENDISIVDLSWNEVEAPDFQDYVVVRTVESDDSTLTQTYATKTASLSDSLYDTKTYFYTVQSRDSSGNLSEKSEPVEVTAIFVSIEDKRELPQNYELKQNYPNPFNPVTQIQFDVPTASHVTIEVFSMLGQQVSTLTNKQYSAGSYTVSFDALGLPSGLYIYRFTSAGYTQIRKMTLIK